MAVYRVGISTPPVRLGKTPFEVAVYDGTEFLGLLTASQGSVDWRPARSRGTIGMSWKRFDAVMEEAGQRDRRLRRSATSTSRSRTRATAQRAALSKGAL